MRVLTQDEKYTTAPVIEFVQEGPKTDELIKLYEKNLLPLEFCSGIFLKSTISNSQNTMEMEESLTLRSLEPPKNNSFCFLCTYGGSTEEAAKEKILGIKKILLDGIGKRSVYDVCDDIFEYYEEEIRPFVDGPRKWTRSPSNDTSSRRRRTSPSHWSSTSAQSFNACSILR